MVGISPLSIPYPCISRRLTTWPRSGRSGPSPSGSSPRSPSSERLAMHMLSHTGLYKGRGSGRAQGAQPIRTAYGQPSLPLASARSVVLMAREGVEIECAGDETSPVLLTVVDLCVSALCNCTRSLSPNENGALDILQRFQRRRFVQFRHERRKRDCAPANRRGHWIGM
jgi:hypothetical protein